MVKKVRKQNFDRKWDFHFKGKTTEVDLPHDFSIIQGITPNAPSAASTGFFPGGVADYKKTFFVPEEWRGKKVYLEFEGVYMHATVRLNHSIVAQHPYGYTSFHADLTPYLVYGKDNTVTVRANNGMEPNSRWYSGSGIYRHVWLLVAEPVHIAPYGVFVYTTDNNVAQIETTVENHSGNTGEYTLRSTVLSAQGKQTSTCQGKQTSARQGEAVASDESSFNVIDKTVVHQSIPIQNANLWSMESPYLYTLKTELLENGTVIDSSETTFGVRSISVDTENGFRLNGKTIKLKGGCVHHDCGILGAASYNRAEERKVELLKANGYNAIRCAHNPPSPAFLDACDRLGMVVMNEAFDQWREAKQHFDYNLFFADWWQRDIASMVLRDRNHPSVIMWSIGNEIWERDGRSDGPTIAQKLHDYVKELDPTRPTINCTCVLFNTDMVPFAKTDDAWDDLTRDFIKPTDVVGYNYMPSRLEQDGKKYPERIIAATETFPLDIFDGWEKVLHLPHVIGDFVWTSLDYLGEAGIGHVWYNGEGTFSGAYPWNQANCGDIDVCGFKRPQSYYKDFVWGRGTAPYMAVYKPEFYGKDADISAWGWPDVTNSWSWPGFEGKPIVIDVYSGGDEVELICNGAPIGRQPAGKGARYTAKFETTYQPGELVAVTYENGVETFRSVLKTASTPVSIKLTPDRNEINATFGDLSFITVELFDKNGNIAHAADNNVYFTASGAGTVVAVGSGNPKSEEMYVGSQRRVHEGKAMVVVMANGEPGNIVLCAMAEGMPTVEIKIKTRTETNHDPI